MSDEVRSLYERLSPDDIASLPPELRAEMSRQSASPKAEARRAELALIKVQRIPEHRRDMSPVKVLVHAKNGPWGEVFEDVEEDVQVDDGSEMIKVEDGVNAKTGEPKYKAVEVKKYRQEMRKVPKLVKRQLVYKERVTMPRWVVDLMAPNDHVVELS